MDALQIFIFVGKWQYGEHGESILWHAFIVPVCVLNRQAWVTFICDPSATTPTMHAIGEQESTVYVSFDIKC